MERRIYPRFESAIEAQMLINGEVHARGKSLNLSASGLAIECETEVEIGDTVIAHLHGGVRFEGVVSRIFDNGFAVRLNMSDAKRNRFARRLNELGASGEPIDKLGSERRGALRVQAQDAHVECECAEGPFEGRIIDMSLTGVALQTAYPLEKGALVVVGKMRGTVVRQTGTVYGVEFIGGPIVADSGDNNQTDGASDDKQKSA